MSYPQQFVDHLGDAVVLQHPPNRIVSLVPSQTELLWDLGLHNRLVGRTKFCIHPSAIKGTVPVVGGTKNINIERIRSLEPDLVIANKEENTKDQILALREFCSVWLSEVTTIGDAVALISDLGELCDVQKQSAELRQKIVSSLDACRDTLAGRVLYLIWKDPWMVVGKNTFIHSMLEHLGLENVINESRYPSIVDGDIKRLNPKYVLLSSEPFPFTSEHVTNLQKCWPGTTVILVDGEMFSWYGSRLLKAEGYFSKLKLTVP